MMAYTRVVMVVAALLCLLAAGAGAYKPVFFMHGINDNESEFDHVEKWVGSHHPGTDLYSIPLYDNDPGSFAPLWLQARGIAKRIRAEIAANATAFADGYHLMCHSQGCITCRAVIALMDDHNIDTFVSLTGPLMGEYGPYEFLQKLWPSVVVPNLWRVLYTALLQDTLSVANFWNDPHQRAEYLKKNKFLPILNNEVPHDSSDAYKANFLRVKKVAVFGSPADEEILPWQSAVFGFFDENERILNFTQTEVYASDSFGLQTLHRAGRLSVQVIPGMRHSDWVHNSDVFKEKVLPLLI